MPRHLLSVAVIAATVFSSVATDAAAGDKSNRRPAANAGAVKRTAVGSNPDPVSGTHLVPIEHTRYNKFGCRNTRERCARNLFGLAIVELSTSPR